MRINVALVLILVITAASIIVSDNYLVAQGQQSLIEVISISITSPKNNAAYVDYVPLVFAASPMQCPNLDGPDSAPFLIGVYSYSIDGQARTTIMGTSNSQAETQTVTSNLTGLNDGEHTIKVYEKIDYFDMSLMVPKSYALAYSNTIGFTLLNTIPTIGNLSIQNKTYNTNSISLEFSVNEPITSASYSLDASENVTMQGNATLIDLEEGSHVIVVYASDIGGNIGASETVYFTVDTRFPSMLIPVIAAMVILVVAVAAVVYLKKHKRQDIPTQQRGVTGKSGLPTRRNSQKPSRQTCSLKLHASRCNTNSKASSPNPYARAIYREV